jgi:hypothetical protein
VYPLYNGLSDYDAQLIKLSDIDIKIQNSKFKIIRRIDTYSVSDFRYKLSFETQNSIFDSNDVNSMFNSLHSIYLRIFYSSFSLKKVNTKTDSHAWITSGIRTSCEHKRDLFLLCNDAKFKNYCKTYCKILSKVIKEAKNYHLNRLIENSDNKMKTIWDIAELLPGKKKY